MTDDKIPPRPWRVLFDLEDRTSAMIVSADNQTVAPFFVSTTSAEHIVDCVNAEYYRLLQLASDAWDQIDDP